MYAGMSVCIHNMHVHAVLFGGGCSYLLLSSVLQCFVLNWFRRSALSDLSVLHCQLCISNFLLHDCWQVFLDLCITNKTIHKLINVLTEDWKTDWPTTDGCAVSGVIRHAWRCLCHTVIV